MFTAPKRPTSFGQRIAPYVRKELACARRNMLRGKPDGAFAHLERAHILGQRSTYWHVVAHVHMLRWAVGCHQPKELAGQLLRIVGAASKTAIGLVPEGNPGGSNISPFARRPVPPDLQAILHRVSS